MDAAVLPPFSIVAGTDVSPASARVRIDGDRILVERLALHDPALAAFLAERSGDDRAELVERALRIGLLALRDAG